MPPIASISSVPPTVARAEPRVRNRQIASDALEETRLPVGARASQAPLTAAIAQAQQQPTDQQQVRLQPPLDLLQRFFSERQAALREAALQRDEVLQQDQSLRPIAQAQREADRLQVLRDAQLLEAQRLAVAPDTERLLAQREAQRLEEQRLSELQRERLQATQLDEQRRLEEEREAARVAEEEEAERVEARRLEEERERARVQELEESERIQAQQEAETERLEVDRTQSDRVLVERAALAYRSESERALAEASATRFEAEQPLSEQFRLARERLDALEAGRIDRVDVSGASLSRLAF